MRGFTISVPKFLLDYNIRGHTTLHVPSGTNSREVVSLFMVTNINGTNINGTSTTGKVFIEKWSYY